MSCTSAPPKYLSPRPDDAACYRRKESEYSDLHDDLIFALCFVSPLVASKAAVIAL